MNDTELKQVNESLEMMSKFDVNYLTEDTNDRDYNLIQAKKKQKNLEYVGWNIYQGRIKDEHFKWDSTKKYFVKVEKEDLDKKAQDRNKEIKGKYSESEHENASTLHGLVQNMRRGGMYESLRNLSEKDIEHIKQYNIELGSKINTCQKLLKKEFEPLVLSLNDWWNKKGKDFKYE
jgi:hypothetical protein